VKSNIVENHKIQRGDDVKLPKSSLYDPARETVERILTGEALEHATDIQPADAWAKQSGERFIKEATIAGYLERSQGMACSYSGCITIANFTAGGNHEANDSL
jgi:hypothetical protein